MDTNGTFVPHPEQPRPRMHRGLCSTRMAQIIHRVFRTCGTDIPLHTAKYLVDAGLVPERWLYE